MLSKTDICKIQISLERGDVDLIKGELVSDKKAPVTMLVYNKDRSIMLQWEADAETLTKMAGRPKAYFKCTVDSTGLKMLEEVKKQNW